MSEVTPTKFEDIDADLLRRQAVEDWAVDVKPSDSLKKVVKAFEDAGVYWEDYAEKYGYDLPPQVNTLDEPDTIENVTPAPSPARASVVDETDTIQRTPEPTRREQPVNEFVDRSPARPQIAYAAPAQVEPGQQYLVKMERENVAYQFGKYKWTKAHPYALVDAKDYERVLRHEPGFRQAYPSEVAEFYS